MATKKISSSPFEWCGDWNIKFNWQLSIVTIDDRNFLVAHFWSPIWALFEKSDYQLGWLKKFYRQLKQLKILCCFLNNDQNCFSHGSMAVFDWTTKKFRETSNLFIVLPTFFGGRSKKIQSLIVATENGRSKNFGHQLWRPKVVAIEFIFGCQSCGNQIYF